jgi:thioesterase domain-containing protein
MAAELLPLVRRVRPHGPYLLGGHCNGGAVAFELARQLQAAGEAVDLLVLVDVPGRNIGLAPYRSMLRRTCRLLRLPPAWDLTVFRATRGSAERLVHAWTSEAGSGSLARRTVRRTVAMTRWLADSSLRAGLRLPGTVRALRPGHLPPAPAHHDSVRGERAAYYLAAMEDYVPETCACRLVLMVPAEGEAPPPSERPELWARLGDSVEVQSIEGDHLGILTDRSDALGRALERLLHSARRPEERECSPS